MDVESNCIAALRPESEWPPDPWLAGITTREVLRLWKPGELVVVTSQHFEHVVISSLEVKADHGFGMRGAIVPTACLRCVVPDKHRFDLHSYGNSARFAKWYDQLPKEGT